MKPRHAPAKRDVATKLSVSALGALGLIPASCTFGSSYAGADSQPGMAFVEIQKAPPDQSNTLHTQMIFVPQRNGSVSAVPVSSGTLKAGVPTSVPLAKSFMESTGQITTSDLVRQRGIEDIGSELIVNRCYSTARWMSQKLKGVVVVNQQSTIFKAEEREYKNRDFALLLPDRISTRLIFDYIGQTGHVPRRYSFRLLAYVEGFVSDRSSSCYGWSKMRGFAAAHLDAMLIGGVK